MPTQKVSLKEAMNITTADLAHMKTRELKKYTTKLASAANRRKETLENTLYGIYSPAYRQVKNRKPFSSRDKDRNQLVNEMLEAQNFLRMKTSTVRGFEEMRKKREKIMGGSFGSFEREKAFWEVYNRVEEQNPDIIGHRGSDEVQRTLYKSIEQGESSELLKKVSVINAEVNYPEMVHEGTVDWEGLRAAYPDVFAGVSTEDLMSGGYFVNEFGDVVNFGYTQDDYVQVLNELARIGYEKKQAVLNEEFRTIAERNKGKSRT